MQHPCLTMWIYFQKYQIEGLTRFGELPILATEIKIMEATYRHTKQVPAVSGLLGSLRFHSLNSPTGSGQNYMPVVVETHRHNPIQPKTGIPVSPMHRLPIRAKREMDVQGRSLSLYKSCRPAQSYLAGLTSFTAGTAGGGQSGTPVGENNGSEPARVAAVGVIRPLAMVVVRDGCRVLHSPRHPVNNVAVALDRLLYRVYMVNASCGTPTATRFLPQRRVTTTVIAQDVRLCELQTTTLI